MIAPGNTTPSPAFTSTLTQRIKLRARELGFHEAGCCEPRTALGWERFEEWLSAGYAGTMRYLPERKDAYQHPSSILKGVRSLILLSMNYSSAPHAPTVMGEGRISRYAWGDVDYHDLIHARLKELCDFLTAAVPGASVRGVVDTAPLLERDYARLAGLGWIGKNTLLLQRQGGSWFFLAALLTDVPLEYDSPFESDHCGTCRACLDACPTNAFPQPYVLDATRCISYLTIELRELPPRELREAMGEWLFGCDVCQDVCPWNGKAARDARVNIEHTFQPQANANPVDLIELFELDDERFRQRFRHTPLWRSKRHGILRNAALVLGNQPPNSRSRAALVRGLNDSHPLVRGASAWALGRDAHSEARRALQARLAEELDDVVRAEIQAALA